MEKGGTALLTVCERRERNGGRGRDGTLAGAEAGTRRTQKAWQHEQGAAHQSNEQEHAPQHHLNDACIFFYVV